MNDVFDEFADALRKKFNRALEKDNSRSKEPWREYDTSWLVSRLYDEKEEYTRATGNIEKAKEAVDIAEFAMFLWKRHILLLDEDMKKCIDCGSDCSDASGYLEGRGPYCINCFIKIDKKLLKIREYENKSRKKR